MALPAGSRRATAFNMDFRTGWPTAREAARADHEGGSGTAPALMTGGPERVSAEPCNSPDGLAP